LAVLIKIKRAPVSVESAILQHTLQTENWAETSWKMYRSPLKFRRGWHVACHPLTLKISLPGTNLKYCCRIWQIHQNPQSGMMKPARSK